MCTRQSDELLFEFFSQEELEVGCADYRRAQQVSIGAAAAPMRATIVA
jgi:hypothetical protein